MNSPRPANVYIGVDGGGTQTRAVAYDSAGALLGSGSASGSNPHNIGFPKAAHSIANAILGAAVPLDARAHLCLGIAGVTTQAHRDALRQQLLAELPPLQQAHLTLTHDLEIAHYAAFQSQPGIVLVAGTGSACFAIDAAGTTYRASGRDFHYEDPGSGYAIGRRAIDSKLMAPADSRESIAALAPRVIELAAGGDAKALDILRIESKHLAKLAQLVYHDYAVSDPRPTIALSGSILSADTLYRAAVRYDLLSDLPGVTLIDVATPPADAAAARARALHGAA